MHPTEPRTRYGRLTSQPTASNWERFLSCIHHYWNADGAPFFILTLIRCWLCLRNARTISLCDASPPVVLISPLWRDRTNWWLILKKNSGSLPAKGSYHFSSF